VILFQTIINQINTSSQQFAIHQLSKKLAILKPTLKFWEKKFERIIILSARTSGGKIRYMEKHFSIIKNFKKLGKTGKGILETK